MRPILVLLVVMLLATSCTAAPKPAEAQVAQSTLPRETAPQLADAELAALVAGNTAFAVDLYQRLREGDANLFFSPHSISVALAMTYAGARGETAAQMAETLHFTLEDAALHRAFNALDAALAAQSAAAAGMRGRLSSCTSPIRCGRSRNSPSCRNSSIRWRRITARG